MSTLTGVGMEFVSLTRYGGYLLYVGTVEDWGKQEVLSRHCVRLRNCHKFLMLFF